MTTALIAILIFLSSAIIGTQSYLHCVSNCHFSQSFDSPLTLSEQCNKTEINYLCQVNLKIDYTRRTFQVTFGSMIYDKKRSLDSKTDKYDYINKVTQINGTDITTRLFYSCALEDQCEQVYLLKILPKLIKEDYRPIQSAVIDIGFTSKSSPLSCATESNGINFACNGTCYGYRNQVLDLKTGQPIYKYDSPSCENKIVSPSLTISTAKVPMDNRIMLSREISFECSTNHCNGPEITNRIEDTINENYLPFYKQ